jgi:hypothetical protein
VIRRIARGARGGWIGLLSTLIALVCLIGVRCSKRPHRCRRRT